MQFWNSESRRYGLRCIGAVVELEIRDGVCRPSVERLRRISKGHGWRSNLAVEGKYESGTVWQAAGGPGECRKFHARNGLGGLSMLESEVLQPAALQRKWRHYWKEIYRWFQVLNDLWSTIVLNFSALVILHISTAFGFLILIPGGTRLRKRKRQTRTWSVSYNLTSQNQSARWWTSAWT